MADARKIRSDTDTGAQQAFAIAQQIAPPPQHLGKKALVYWRAIYTRRAADEWNDLDLLKACQLAKLYVERDVDFRKIKRDGGSVHTDGKTVKRNPRDIVLNARETQIMRMERHLRLHANADHKDVSQIRGQRQAEAAARAAIEAAHRGDGQPGDGDPLLPMFDGFKVPNSRPQ